jgi:ParB-like chromosome segregation protein Spo0J
MAALEADVKKNGFRNPARVSPNADGSIALLDGSHRAAVAYHLGIALPVSNGDNEDTRHTNLWHKKLRQISGQA